MQKYSNSPKPTNGLDFYIAKNQRYQQYPIKKGDFRNETGKTLETLGTELQRQRAARQDFVAKKPRRKTCKA